MLEFSKICTIEQRFSIVSLFSSKQACILYGDRVFTFDFLGRDLDEEGIRGDSIVSFVSAPESKTKAALYSNRELMIYAGGSECKIKSVDKFSFLFEHNGVVYFLVEQNGKLTMKMIKGNKMKTESSFKFRHVRWWKYSADGRYVAIMIFNKVVVLSFTERTVNKIIEAKISFVPTDFYVMEDVFFIRLEEESFTVYCPSRMASPSVYQCNGVMTAMKKGSLLILFNSSTVCFITPQFPPEFIESSAPVVNSDCAFDEQRTIMYSNSKFYRITINWHYISRLMSKKSLSSWKLVGFLAATNSYIKDISSILCENAANSNYPAGLSAFILEYSVSSLFCWMKAEHPGKLIDVLSPTSIHTYDRVYASESDVLEAIRSQIDVKMCKFRGNDSVMTPKGFWKRSTVFYLIIYHLIAKRKSTAITNVPYLRVLPKPVIAPASEIIRFAEDFVLKQELLANCIPLPSDQKTRLTVLLSEFETARYNHLPFPVFLTEEMKKLTSMFFSPTMQLFSSPFSQYSPSQHEENTESEAYWRAMLKA